MENSNIIDFTHNRCYKRTIYKGLWTVLWWFI